MGVGYDGTSMQMRRKAFGVLTKYQDNRNLFAVGWMDAVMLRKRGCWPMSFSPRGS